MPKKAVELEPEVAAAFFAKDADSIGVRLPDLLRGLGVGLKDILPDLQSGLLVGTLLDDNPTTPGAFIAALEKGEIYFTGSALVRWFAERPEMLARMERR